MVALDILLKRTRDIQHEGAYAETTQIIYTKPHEHLQRRQRRASMATKNYWLSTVWKGVRKSTFDMTMFYASFSFLSLSSLPRNQLLVKISEQGCAPDFFHKRIVENINLYYTGLSTPNLTILFYWFINLSTPGIDKKGILATVSGSIISTPRNSAYTC